MNKEFAQKLVFDPNDDVVDQLFDGVGGVFWVDWREADENIINLAAQVIGNDSTGTNRLLSPLWQDGRLYVNFRGKLTEVPLKFEPGEQYITLASINEAISPAYQIRYVKASEGGDTVAYMVLTAQTLSELEAQFGAKISEAFQAVDQNSAYFKQAAAEQAGIRAAKEAKDRELAERQARIDAGGSEYQTLVHTKEGLKPIEDIRVGDWVLSHPASEPLPFRRQAPWRLENEYTYRQVTKVSIEKRPVSYFKCGYEREILKIASDQLIWEGHQEWIPVARLQGVDFVGNSNYAETMVSKPKHTTESDHFYLLEVDEFHTYYVGKNGLWVHDASEFLPSPADMPPERFWENQALVANGAKHLAIVHSEKTTTKSDANYYTTSLTNISEKAVRVRKYAGFVQADNGYRLCTTTKKWFGAGDFVRDYGTRPDGWIKPGETVADGSNCGHAPDGFWAFWCENQDGECFAAIIKLPVM